MAHRVLQGSHHSGPTHLNGFKNMPLQKEILFVLLHSNVVSQTLVDTPIVEVIFIYLNLTVTAQQNTNNFFFNVDNFRNLVGLNISGSLIICVYETNAVSTRSSEYLSRLNIIRLTLLTRGQWVVSSVRSPNILL